MRALLQRVRAASVSVGDEAVGDIGAGLLVFLGVSLSDSAEDAAYLVDKIANLRIFPDAQGRFDVSALDVCAETLVVSQFTLYADTRRGRRPSFTDAAGPVQARALYESFIALLRETGLAVATGRFQEHMLVELQNDGPVTIMLDSVDRHLSKRGDAKGAT